MLALSDLPALLTLVQFAGSPIKGGNGSQDYEVIPVSFATQKDSRAAPIGSHRDHKPQEEAWAQRIPQQSGSGTEWV